MVTTVLINGVILATLAYRHFFLDRTLKNVFIDRCAWVLFACWLLWLFSRAGVSSAARPI